MGLSLSVPRSRAREAIGRGAAALLAAIPPARATQTEDAASAARRISLKAAREAAILSGSLALPPGPTALLTLLPDLYLIWRVQQQMVADIFAVHGKSAELTPAHMVHCLFRHLASHAVRGLAVRAGERLIVGQLAGKALESTVTQVLWRAVRQTTTIHSSRWIPLAGAVAVAAYAHRDTLRVAREAVALIEDLESAGKASPQAAVRVGER